MVYENNDFNLLLYKIMGCTQNAAIACYDLIGRGDSNLADQSAVNAIRESLSSCNFGSRIAIGEGERDKAPMLFIGEELGVGEYQYDIAVDPLECTSVCAKHGEGSLSVIGISDKGNIIHAPDVYMDKIVVGISNFEKGFISLDNSPEINLKNLAYLKGCEISELLVIILNRERHNGLIAKIRRIGAKIKLIEDGDISAVLSVLIGKADMYIGIGGAPEGVLGSIIVNELFGFMQGRFIIEDETQKIRAMKMGINEIAKIYDSKELVKGKSGFVATGITKGSILNGIEKHENRITTESIIIHSGSIKMVCDTRFNASEKKKNIK